MTAQRPGSEPGSWESETPVPPSFRNFRLKIQRSLKAEIGSLSYRDGATSAGKAMQIQRQDGVRNLCMGDFRWFQFHGR